jgi:hypothetical protein
MPDADASGGVGFTVTSGGAGLRAAVSLTSRRSVSGVAAGYW